MSDSKKATPAAKISVFPVSCAVWRNETPKGVFFNTTFERSYKDDKGRWQTASDFPVGTLLLLAKVADLAHTEILKLREQDRTSDQTDDEAA